MIPKFDPDEPARRERLLDQMLSLVRERNGPVGLQDILIVLRENPDIAWPADPESCARLLVELSAIATEVRLREREA